MLKEHESVFRRLLMASDAIIIVAAFWISYYLKFPVEKMLVSQIDVLGLYPLMTYINLLPWVIAIWISSLYFIGSYQTFRAKNISQIVTDLMKGFAVSFTLFGGIVFILKLHYLSRIFIGLVFALSLLFLSIARVIFVTALFYFRKKGYNFRELLVIGTGKRAQNFLSLIKKHPEWGFKVVGLVDEHPELQGTKVMGLPVIGKLTDIPDILEQHIVDEVIILVPRSWLSKMEEAILYCENLGKRVSIAVDLFNPQFSKITQTKIHALPFLTFETTTDKLWQLLLKRIADFFFCAVGLIILSPILLLVAFLIKKTSPGPILFIQKRSTLNGRIFSLYKFRTMEVNAEAKLETLKKHNEMSGPVFKMKKDPRVTPLGYWLRKFSIDEFPQLWNVLKGDMSLIGPRPPIPAEVKKYEPWQRRRLSMLPGISGLWQVNGRNKISDFDQWMKLDLEYIDTWSLWLDLKIFLKTIPVVIFGIGAK